MENVAFFDIDGTLADDSKKTEYDADLYYTDEVLIHLSPRKNVVRAVTQYLKLPEWTVVICTGRSVDLKDSASAWLQKHLGTNEFHLIMRPLDVPGQAVSTYKAEMCQRIYNKHRFNRLHVYEDNVETLLVIHELFSSRPVDLQLVLAKDGLMYSYDPNQEERIVMTNIGKANGRNKNSRQVEFS